jgi:NADH-quinone oxidoreductase subunit K
MTLFYQQVLVLAGLLFLIGFFCALTRRNLIMILIGVEIMLNGSTVALVGAALRWQNLEGQAFVLFILAIAAAEVTIGLALIVCAYRRTGSVDPGNYRLLG